MGGGDESSEEIDSDQTERRILPFNNTTRGFFMFFTEFSKRRLFRRLANYLRDKDVESKLSASDWSMTFKVERELDDMEIEEGVEADTCEIKVELL